MEVVGTRGRWRIEIGHTATAVLNMVVVFDGQVMMVIMVHCIPAVVNLQRRVSEDFLFLFFTIVPS